MNIITTKDYEAMSQTTLAIITDSLAANPQLLLCLATGATPTRTYELLVAERSKAPHLFDALRIVKLDEWGGLAAHDPVSSEAALQRAIIQPLGIGNDRYTTFQCNPADPVAECQRIQQALDEIGPIDLSVLGLGTNGHLGFNEPADFLQPFPHVATLAPSTLQHPSVQQTLSPITHGLTLGMANILQSRHILLPVNGPHKREPLARLLSGEIATDFPASLLWLHPNVTIVCDEAAYEDLH